MNNCAYCNVEVDTGKFICSKCSGIGSDLDEISESGEVEDKVTTATDERLGDIPEDTETATAGSVSVVDQPFVGDKENPDETELEDESASQKKKVQSSESKATIADSRQIEVKVRPEKESLQTVSRPSRDDLTDSSIKKSSTQKTPIPSAALQDSGEEWKTEPLHPALQSRSRWLFFLCLILPWFIVIHTIGDHIIVICFMALVSATIALVAGAFYFRDLKWFKCASWVYRNVEPQNAVYSFPHKPGSHSGSISLKCIESTSSELEMVRNITIRHGSPYYIGWSPTIRDTPLPVKARIGKIAGLQVLILESGKEIVWCEYIVDSPETSL